jgi:hypothetical protein
MGKDPPSFGFKSKGLTTFSSMKTPSKDTWLEKPTEQPLEDESKEDLQQEKVDEPEEREETKPDFQCRAKIFRKDVEEWKNLGAMLLSFWDAPDPYIGISCVLNFDSGPL